MRTDVASPYRFLSSYRAEDQDLFFGRDPEINILVADIVTARLVVLFAKTGTGKTSLINAGVRPVLAERGFETYYVRVERDPITSARKELGRRHHDMLAGEAFGQELVELASSLEQPIVVFFDQFEEFFLYIVKEEPELANEFVAAVGDIYDNRGSGVHIVFSMREEFFVELDLMRDRIPSIYHADSNLRLRHLRPHYAKQAIKGPARAAGVTIVDAVVEAIIDDLARGNGHQGEPLVEPAQLQIVCDELWSRRAGDRITLADYRVLGVGGPDGTVAQAILLRRVSAELEAIPDQKDLELAQQLLPLLRHERQTKQIQTVDALVQLLELDAERGIERLHGLLRRLAGARVVDLTYRIDQVEAVELTHDYLVEHLDQIVEEVGLIWPRRVLRRLLDRFRKGGQLATLDELDDVVEELPRLDVRDDASDAAELLLRSALACQGHGLEAFDFAAKLDVEPMEIIAAFVRGEDRALGGAAATLLAQLVRVRPRARSVGFALLQEMLAERLQTGDAQAVLARLAADPELDADLIRDPAAQVLVAYMRTPGASGRLTRDSISFLGGQATDQAVDLLEEALSSPGLVLAAQDALVNLLGSEQVGSRAAEVLVAFAAANLPDLDARTIRQLALISTPDAVNVLARATAQPELRNDAEAALKQLRDSDSPVAVRARDALMSSIATATSPTSEAPRRVGTAVRERLPSPTEPTLVSGQFERLVRALSDERAVLLVGPGVHYPPPPESPFVYPETDRPPLGSDLSEMLAARCDFSFIYPGENPRNLQRVAQCYETQLGRAELEVAVRDAFRGGRKPSPLVRALAELPFPMVITTTWDALLERALNAIDKQPILSTYSPRPYTPPREFEPEVRTPLILKLGGDANEQGSMVLTEDDHITQVLRLTEQPGPIPLGVRYLLSRMPTIAVGYSLYDFFGKMLLRVLNWQTNPASRPETYVVDIRPDPMLTRQWAEGMGVTFIAEDVWSFVPRLYESVTGKPMAP